MEKLSKGDLEKLESLYNELVAVFGKVVLYVNINKLNNNVIFGKEFLLKFGKPVSEEICGLKVNVNPESFMQINNEIRDKIYFDNNRTTIKKKSYSLLDQVAHTILANPKITKLTVEGHTDDTGSYEHNLTLSRGRAQAVVDYLITQGISPDRLSAIGYGPDKPLDPAKTKKARALNRRVEFVITEKK